MGNSKTVYVLDASNHVHIRNVEVGLEGSKLAEIKSGLEPGRSGVSGRPGQISARTKQVSPILSSSPSV